MTSWTVLACLALSLVALAVAPAVIGDGYRIAEHTTSESGAQGVDGAWVARLGFLAFGFGVLWLAVAGAPRWSGAVRFAHGVFGVLMTSVAAFSVRPWRTGAPYDRVEDVLHSIGATGMGFAFVAGVVLLIVQGRRTSRPRMLDVLAVAAGTLLPPLMGLLPDIDGLLQRAMFVVAYAWYAREALRGNGATATAS